jgi:hypothetical protein
MGAIVHEKHILNAYIYILIIYKVFVSSLIDSNGQYLLQVDIVDCYVDSLLAPIVMTHCHVHVIVSSWSLSFLSGSISKRNIFVHEKWDITFMCLCRDKTGKHENKTIEAKA